MCSQAICISLCNIRLMDHNSGHKLFFLRQQSFFTSLNWHSITKGTFRLPTSFHSFRAISKMCNVYQFLIYNACCIYCNQKKVLNVQGNLTCVTFLLYKIIKRAYITSILKYYFTFEYQMVSDAFYCSNNNNNLFLYGCSKVQLNKAIYLDRQ